MSVGAMPPLHVIPRGPHDVDAYFNGAFLGSFPTSASAWTELDLVNRYEHSREGSDPAAPFAVNALPSLTIPVTDDEIEAAYQAFIEFYAHSDQVLKRAERARTQVVLKRDSWTSYPTGGIEVPGSAPRKGADPVNHLITLSEDGLVCRCSDHIFKGHANGTMCKHVIGLELVRMAQMRQQAHPVTAMAALLPPTISEAGPTPAERTEAFIELACRRLVRALGLLVEELWSEDSGDHVMFAYVDGRLIIDGGEAAIRLEIAAHGSSTISLPATTVLRFYERLKHLVATEPEIVLRITPERLDIIGEQFEMGVDAHSASVTVSITPAHQCANGHPIKSGQNFCTSCGSGDLREVLPRTAEPGDLCSIRSHGAGERRQFQFTGRCWTRLNPTDR